MSRSRTRRKRRPPGPFTDPARHGRAAKHLGLIRSRNGPTIRSVPWGLSASLRDWRRTRRSPLPELLMEAKSQKTLMMGGGREGQSGGRQVGFVNAQSHDDENVSQ